MGSNHEKNRGRKSGDTHFLTSKVFFRVSQCIFEYDDVTRMFANRARQIFIRPKNWVLLDKFPLRSFIMNFVLFLVKIGPLSVTLGESCSSSMQAGRFWK